MLLKPSALCSGCDNASHRAADPARRFKVTSTEKKAFLLRVDPALWAELERLASTDLRSVNAQIEFMLREALERRGVRPKAPKKSRSA